MFRLDAQPFPGRHNVLDDDGHEVHNPEVSPKMNILYIEMYLKGRTRRDVEGA